MYITIATADIGMYEEIGDKGNGMFTVHRINVNTSVYVCIYVYMLSFYSIAIISEVVTLER